MLSAQSSNSLVWIETFIVVVGSAYSSNNYRTLTPCHISATVPVLTQEPSHLYAIVHLLAHCPIRQGINTVDGQNPALPIIRNIP